MSFPEDLILPSQLHRLNTVQRILLFLREQFGTWNIQAEEGKKENRSRGVFEMTFSKFLDTYQYSDIYMVEDVLPSSKLAGKCLKVHQLLNLLRSCLEWLEHEMTRSVA